MQRHSLIRSAALALGPPGASLLEQHWGNPSLNGLNFTSGPIPDNALFKIQRTGCCVAYALICAATANPYGVVQITSYIKRSALYLRPEERSFTAHSDNSYALGSRLIDPRARLYTLTSFRG